MFHMHYRRANAEFGEVANDLIRVDYGSVVSRCRALARTEHLGFGDDENVRRPQPSVHGPHCDAVFGMICLTIVVEVINWFCINAGFAQHFIENFPASCCFCDKQGRLCLIF